MNGPVSDIAGQLVAMARHYSPKHAFAALTHNGTDVVFSSFDGRVLDRSSKVPADGKLHGLFAELQKANRRKAGMFKKEGYKSVRVVYRARTRESRTELNFDDASAFVIDPEQKRRAYGILIGDTFPDPAQEMFGEPLPEGLSPGEIAKLYMADYKEWNDFAFAESQQGDDKRSDREARWNQGQSYDRLILRYCGPDNQYQNLAYGSSDKHHPKDETVQSERIEGDTAQVKTLYQNPKIDILKNTYRYEFKRIDGRWLLDELFVCLDDGDYPCL